VRNRRQAAVGAAGVLKHVLEKDLQKRRSELEYEYRFLKATFGEVLLKYSHHIDWCPWRTAATEERCTCGLHDLIAQLLPQHRRCSHCPHPIGYHIRTQLQTTYCIGHDGQERCKCTTDPVPSVEALDAILARKRA
jgi:hypothetical protein